MTQVYRADDYNPWLTPEALQREIERLKKELERKEIIIEEQRKLLHAGYRK